MLRILSALRNPVKINNVLTSCGLSRSISVHKCGQYLWSNIAPVKHVSFTCSTYTNKPDTNCLRAGENPKKASVQSSILCQNVGGQSRNFNWKSSKFGAVVMMGALSFFKKKENEDSPTIESTIAKALFEERKGHIHEAEKIMHQALSKSLADKNEKAVTYIYDQMANMTLRQGKYKEAEVAFKETLRRLISSGTDKTDPAIVEISLKLAQIYSSTSRVSEAQHGFRWCMESTEARIKSAQVSSSASTSIHDKKMDTESSSPPTNLATESTSPTAVPETEYLQNLQALLGMCLEGYARFFVKYKKYDDAIELYKRALSICENDLMENGQPHYESVSILNDLGTVYDLKGEYDQAKEHIRRSLKLAQTLGHQESLPVIVCNLAAVEANHGNYGEAKRLYRKALKESEREGDSRTTLVIKNKLAQLETDILLKKKKPTKTP